MKAKIEETVKAESVKTSQTATESAAIIKPGLTKAERAFLERQEKQVSGSIVMDNEIVLVSVLIVPVSVLIVSVSVLIVSVSILIVSVSILIVLVSVLMLPFSPNQRSWIKHCFMPPSIGSNIFVANGTDS